MNWRTLAFAIMACVLAVTVSAQEGMPARTINGTVVSSSATQLVLDTDTGRKTFDVDAQSSLPTGLAVGARVDIEYHEMSGGRLHLASARMSAAAQPAPATADTPPAAQPTMADDDDDAPATTRSLPRTASPLPLVGLAGLLFLAGGVALRRR